MGGAAQRVPRRQRATLLGAQDSERPRRAPEAAAAAGEDAAARDGRDAITDGPRKALERFRDEFDAKYPKAVAKLDKDWDALTAFFDFPAEHWRRLRTTNPIESSFATVKLRTKVTKGAGSKKAALAMAYKLWTRPGALATVQRPRVVADVFAGVKFNDGIKVTDDDTTTTDERVAA